MNKPPAGRTLRGAEHRRGIGFALTKDGGTEHLLKEVSHEMPHADSDRSG